MTTAWNRKSSPKPLAGICAAALMLGLGACASDSIGTQVDGPAPVAVGTIGELGERVLIPVADDPMIGKPLYSDAARGFSTYDWIVSEYTPAPGLQDVTWNKSHVSLGDRYLSLMITPPAERGKRFGSGEIQTQDAMGYGRYEAVLRPAAGSGLLSSFYARSEGDDERGVSEFGFAFPGRDTDDAFIRLVVDDEVLVQERVDLDFNVTQGFHTYAIDWTEDALVWTVDGAEVYRVERTLAKLPEQPGKMFANIWTGTAEQAHWMGRPRFSSGASLDIACIAHTPLGGTAVACPVPGEAPRAMAVIGGMGG